MKANDIRFFDQSENEEAASKKKAKKTISLTGYISPAGKLVLPNKTIDQLGLSLETASFKVGTKSGKRKAKQLFLLPTTDTDSSTFMLEKAAKSYSISLPYILQKNGVDFANHKYTFTIDTFEYNGVTGYSLKLSKPTVKAPKSGKVGRPRKIATSAE